MQLPDESFAPTSMRRASFRTSTFSRRWMISLHRSGKWSYCAMCNNSPTTKSQKSPGADGHGQKPHQPRPDEAPDTPEGCLPLLRAGPGLRPGPVNTMQRRSVGPVSCQARRRERSVARTVPVFYRILSSKRGISSIATTKITRMPAAMTISLLRPLVHERPPLRRKFMSRVLRSRSLFR